MAKIKKDTKRKVAGYSSASMSDIVFMLLFFFMVTTSMRQHEVMVTVRLPEASEATKLERKDLTSYIYIGTPVRAQQAQYGTDARIQLNDSYKTVDDIRDFIASQREQMNEYDRQFMTVSLKIDSDVRMGIVTDVKQELRRTSALKIMYSARKLDKSGGM
ncbi:MAG: biopolymer transporter ExbD [Prevotellaceae bacterium]|jgi:biopolymer transport protein ExbD|nr:biopolymer transporter ExbD [Prevotellaceae bacterium]